MNFGIALGAPSTLAYYEIDDTKLDMMADKAMAKGEYGKFKTLNREDTLAIYRAFTLKIIWID